MKLLIPQKGSMSKIGKQDQKNYILINKHLFSVDLEDSGDK